MPKSSELEVKVLAGRQVLMGQIKMMACCWPTLKPLCSIEACRDLRSPVLVVSQEGGGHRSSTSSIDSNVSSKSAGATGSKLREPSKISERSSPVSITQADKDKDKVSDSESVSLSSSPKSSPTSASACGTQGLRQPGSKYPDIASPTFRRLFGTKAGNKPLFPWQCRCCEVCFRHVQPQQHLPGQTSSLDSPSSGT
ncbi:unnamed protein product, partial [Ranitomeya imitator]